jgi:hypothetical protein
MTVAVVTKFHILLLQVAGQVVLITNMTKVQVAEVQAVLENQKLQTIHIHNLQRLRLVV